MVEVWSMGLSPPCRAVLLTAKAVGVDVNVNEIDLFKGKILTALQPSNSRLFKPCSFQGEQMAPEFIAVNPAHCVPTMRDGELTIWESRAICQYLANKYQKADSR